MNTQYEAALVAMQPSTAPVPLENAPRRRKACENCRRRKERCDGLNPCGRCRRRRVPDECRPPIPGAHPSSRQSKKAVEPRFTAVHPSGADAREASAPAGPQDGLEPPRGFTPTSSSPFGSTADQDRMISSSQGSIVLHTSPLIRKNHGAYVVLGPSANLSLLQSIRQIVQSALGTCSFTEERPENDLVDDEDATSLLSAIDPGVVPQRPSEVEARYYLRWYARATSCVFDLFELEELETQNIPWLCRPAAADPHSCMNFLVLAIGAQCAPDDHDAMAYAYFAYARHLASTEYLATPNDLTVQIYCLITAYLLNAAQPIAAKMHLSLAIQAARSLGIHEADVLDLFPPEVASKRERIWKLLRVLDLFLSTYLGQQPSTTETRDTMSQQEYSASTDLCYIFEKILAEIYAKQQVSPAVLQHVSRHHREWASRFREGLQTDRISADEDAATRAADGLPNIGLCHLKEAYYWTILLVTRPYLLEMVQKRVAKDSDDHHPPPSAATDEGYPSQPTSNPDTLLAHASVNSAVLTIDLLQGFLTAGEIPKRLPYIINSIFNAALVLGMGFFADLHTLFPLSRAMRLAEQLLHRFESHDAQARWSLRIVRNLHKACEELLERRCEWRLKHQRILVEGLFGDVKSSDGSSSDSGSHRVYAALASTPSSPPFRLSQHMHLRIPHSAVKESLHIQQSLPRSPSTDFFRSLQLEENSAIWGQLFYNDPPEPLCEPVQGLQDMPYDWM